MRALILGTTEKEALFKLKTFADAHRIGVDEFLDIYNGDSLPVGDRAGFAIEIPVGYRLVFCIEHQRMGWARHLSVSIHPKKPGRCAHPEAIKEFMTYLGFESNFDKNEVIIYFEEQDTIINVIEYIK